MAAHDEPTPATDPPGDRGHPGDDAPAARHPESLSGDSALALPEFDAPPAGPLALLRRWLDDAAARGVREPRAFTLATVDPRGRPSSRTVLLKAVDQRGLVFTSHTGSRKGVDLAGTPSAAATFYLRELLQQINVEGAVEVLAGDASDALFAERPRSAQATAAVSQQSRPLESADRMRAAAEALLATDRPIARPAGWCGYRLVPDRVEFWHGSPDRLHRRLEYLRAGDGWRTARLQP